MRFAFSLYVTCVLMSVSLMSSASNNPEPIAGYHLQKMAVNLGSVIAIASTAQSIFVLDGKNGRVVRLYDQDGDGRVDIRSVYLIGFERPTDMVSFGDNLYISDANGLWKNQVESGLAATQTPINIFPNANNEALYPTALTLAPDGKTLYVGADTTTGNTDNNIIFAIDLYAHQTQIISMGAWRVRALSTTPTGQLWAALSVDKDTHLSSINVTAGTGIDIPALKFSNTNVHDIVLWQSRFLVASGGQSPKISQFEFSYSSLSDKQVLLVGGFFRPGIAIGKSDILGTPSAMTVLRNGNLIFADSKTGVLWQMAKSATQPKNPAPQPIVINGEQMLSQKKNQRPDVLKGSSIIKASTLSHGSAIGKDELLKTNKSHPTQMDNDTTQTDP